MIGVVLAGIGGQGTIVLAKMLTNALVLEGFEVAELETLGAIQRGGPVRVEIQYGHDRVGGPVPFASADLVIAQEVYEGMRVCAKFLRDGGTLLQNAKLVPVVGHFRSRRGFVRANEYTDVIPPCVGTLYNVDATALALKAGNPRAENMALWGAAIGLGLLPIGPDTARRMIQRFMTGQAMEFSLAAFTTGLQFAESGALPRLRRSPEGEWESAKDAAPASPHQARAGG